MDALHARYPFLASSREAVEAADVDRADVIRDGGPIVQRARARVVGAIEDGRVGQPDRSTRTELLSYPVARVLVSLVDEQGLTRRYAQAEADTAYDRFTADLADGVELRSVERASIELDRLLGELDLGTDVERVEGATAGAVGGGGVVGSGGAVDDGGLVDDGGTDSDGAAPGDDFAVAVGRYLDLAGDLDGERWRLVHRVLAAGDVSVSREELYGILREAIRIRVEDGLPLPVPEEIGDALADEVETLRGKLAGAELPIPDAVEPELFPPCVRALRERAAAGESLPPHSRFALSSFLVTIGMDADEIVASFDDDPEVVREQVAHLREGDRAEYPSPSCATMQAYGDCVNVDSLCETVAHPLEYYDERLDGVEPDQLSRPESQ